MSQPYGSSAPPEEFDQLNRPTVATRREVTTERRKRRIGWCGVLVAGKKVRP
jgi:hypothetical protein